MKTVKQLLEQYKLEEDSIIGNLSVLVETGMLEPNKLPILRRAFSNQPEKMSLAEKKALLETMAILSEQMPNPDYLSKMDTRKPHGFPPEKDIPSVIILKRKAIRVFPDHQKIALYYSQALDKYVSIPYGPHNNALGIQLSEQLDEHQIVQVVPPNNDKIDIFDQSGKPRTPRRKLPPGWAKAAKEVEKKYRYSQASDYAPHIPLNDLVKLPGGNEAATDYINNISSAPVRIGAHIARMRALKKAGGPKPIKQNPPPKPRTRGKNIATDAAPVLANAVSENFKAKLQKLREEKEQLDEFGPVLPVLGAIAARALPVAARALPVISRGIASGVSAAAKGGQKVISRMRPKPGGFVSRTANKMKDAAINLAGTQSNASDGESDNESPVVVARHDGSEHRVAEPGHAAAFKGDTPRQTVSSADAAKSRVGVGLPAYGKPQQNESNFDKIKNIVEQNMANDTVKFGKTELVVNKRMAKKIINLYESLNNTNKKKLKTMLNENVSSFKKAVNFAIGQ